MTHISKTIRAAMMAVAMITASNISLADSIQKASDGLSGASVQIVRGSGDVLAGGSEFVVTSVRFVGDVMLVVLEGASGMVELSFAVVGGAAEVVALAAGEAVTASSTGAGTAIARTNGEVIAFIPDAAGQALTHDTQYQG